MNVPMSFRLTKDEREILRSSAERNGETVSSLVRRLVMTEVSRTLAMTETTWWVTTERLAKGGRKVLGPFPTREEAIDARACIERLKHRNDYWVDSEAVSQGSETHERDRARRSLPDV